MKPWTIFFPREYMQGEEKKSEFLKVGVAFPHREGRGFNCEMYFRILPGSKLVILPPKEEGGPPEDILPAGDDDIPF